MSKNDALGGKWCLPFPGSDRSVLKRSQYYFYENMKERPVQIGTYIAFPNVISAFMVLFTAVIFGIFSMFHYGRKLLLAVSVVLMNFTYF